MENTENNVQVEQKNEEVTTSTNEIGTKIKDLIKQNEKCRSTKLGQLMNYEKIIESLKTISEKNDNDFMINGVLPESFVLSDSEKLNKWFDLKEKIESGKLDIDEITEDFMYEDWCDNWITETIESGVIDDIDPFEYIDSRDFLNDNLSPNDYQIEHIQESFYKENYSDEKDLLKSSLNQKCRV